MSCRRQAGQVVVDWFPAMRRKGLEDAQGASPMQLSTGKSPAEPSIARWSRLMPMLRWTLALYDGGAPESGSKCTFFGDCDAMIAGLGPRCRLRPNSSQPDL